MEDSIKYTKKLIEIIRPQAHHMFGRKELYELTNGECSTHVVKHCQT